MPDEVVPDPEFQPAVDLAEQRALRVAQEVQGVAEREASALMARGELVASEHVHAIVTVAFLKGYMHGARSVLGTWAEVVDGREREVQS